MVWHLHIGWKLRSLEPPEVLTQIWQDLVKKLRPPEWPLLEVWRFFQWCQGMSRGIQRRFREKNCNFFFRVWNFVPTSQRNLLLLKSYKSKSSCWVESFYISTLVSALPFNLIAGITKLWWWYLCVYVSPRNWWAEQVFPIILTKICKWIFSLKVEISMAFLLLKFSLFLIHSSGNSFLVDMNSQPGKITQSITSLSLLLRSWSHF